MPFVVLCVLCAPKNSHEQLDRQNNQAYQKNKQADAIDPMHIPDPFVLRPVGILLFQVEVFGNLVPDAHEAKFTIPAYNSKLLFKYYVFEKHTIQTVICVNLIEHN